jgi:hypothetical protein
VGTCHDPAVVELEAEVEPPVEIVARSVLELGLAVAVAPAFFAPPPDDAAVVVGSISRMPIHPQAQV